MLQSGSKLPRVGATRKKKKAIYDLGSDYELLTGSSGIQTQFTCDCLIGHILADRALIQILPQHFPGGDWNKTTENLSKDSRYLGRDSNQAPREYNTRALQLCRLPRWEISAKEGGRVGSGLETSSCSHQTGD
jgi:hypothetical protein